MTIRLLLTLFLFSLLAKNGLSQELSSSIDRPDLLIELKELSLEEGRILLNSHIDLINKLVHKGNYLAAYEQGLWLLDQDSVFEKQPISQQNLYRQFGILMGNLELYELANKFLTKKSKSIFSKEYIPAWLYRNQGKLDSAIIASKFQLLEKINLGNPLFISSAYNNLGWHHSNAKHIDSARFYYLTALKELDNYRIQKKIAVNFSESERLEISILENLARLLNMEKNYAKAISLIDSVLYKFEDRFNNSNKIDNHWIGLNQKKMDASIGLKDYKLLNKLLQKLELKKIDPQVILGSVYRLKQENLNNYWLEYYLKIGDRNSVEKRLLRRNIYQDSLKSIVNLQRNKIFAKSIELELKNLAKEKDLLIQLQQKEFQIAEERTKKKNVLIIFSILGIGIISLFFLFNSLQRKKKRLQVAENDKHHLNSLLKLEEKNSELVKKDLINRQKDLIDLSIRIKREEKWADGLVELYQSLKSKNVTNPQERLNIIVDDIKTSLIIDEKQLLIKENIELLSNEFRLSLKMKFPNLVETEIELCELIRLNLSNAEIAKIRSISEDSVRKSRYRLKIKMDLSTDQFVSDTLTSL